MIEQIRELESDAIDMGWKKRRDGCMICPECHKLNTTTQVGP